MIPHALVLAHATRHGHTNSWRFILRDEVWGWRGVEDVTAVLRAALMTLSATAEPHGHQRDGSEPRLALVSELRKAATVVRHE
jgi:hypothetical protein